MATKKTSTRKNDSGARRRRPQPDIAQSWSILLFGLGAVLVAMIFVEGESAWAWMRAALFGVFGLGMYALGLLVLYVAVLVALGLPIWSKCAKALCLMMFLCGTAVVFSRVNLTGMDFGQVVKALYEQGQGALGGGVLGGVVGGTLLVLCGRPAANILLVVLLAAGIMWFAGVTPGDLWNLVAGRYALWQEGRAERAALLEEEREEEPAEPQPRRRERPAPAPKARRRASQVDIDLGPDPVQETDLAPDPEEPLVGPGGTFGMFPPQDAPQPAKTPSQEDSEFETPIFLEGDEEPAPGRPDTKESMPETVGGSDLDDLVQRAMGAASAAQMTPAAVVPGKNDQMMIAPAAAEQQVYHYPPLSLFERAGAAEDPGVEEELKKNAELLVSTLESFGVRTRVLDICRGPSVTRYELQPLAGVKISRITGLADDIALNLAAGGVRIEAPIPGKPAVGVEVPNRKKSPVGIRSIFESPVYSKSASPLTLALGKDIAGNAQIADLCKMPHLLIAGSTGSGKSVCVNSIIISFLYKASPEDVRLILIDPKVVELAEYNGIPHLLMPVVTEPRKAAGALGSAVAEMERRYHLFAENNVRDIKSFNRLAAEADGLEKLPYIAIIIDELADLMMVAGKEVEDYICRIAQKARAAGMHLIVATQRPSVDVITGLIKANIPSRIAFAVSSQVDSRTILDAGGAEKLLGMGDMLFMPVGAAKPVRIQGTYVKDDEISAVLDFIKQDNTSQYDEEMIAQMDKLAAAEKGSGSGGEEGDGGHDPMLDQAVEVVIDAGQASTSLLQRRCKLGYARAARIMDEMEQLGVIGPYQGAKPREVLVTRQQWIEKSMRAEAAPAPDEI
ncbi:DNA translocase FtsK [Candidatus Allofournierella excrementigallinarum]|uniref:DNA translocase FtsK n=1 Tax=Candidatus Allofournierella excrementigallinarum TaxID=2838592 RepID=UPI00374F38AF